MWPVRPAGAAALATVPSPGVKASRALDRYLRERRRHPYADTPRLWLGSRGRAALAADDVEAMLKRRGADAGITDLHPHAFRHAWAHAFRAAGAMRAT
jgi:site-specific recombinase XerD